MVSSKELLGVLPTFTNSSLLIEGNQNVPDIIREVLEAHKYFSNDYDCIYLYFDKGSIENICRSLFNFCKRYVRYKIEGENEQTTKSPSALLALAYGDCKHYAGFIAGVLCAIQRNTGKKINWCYRFASYDLFNKEPGHVFVVVKDRGTEYWIDPVLNEFNERLQPSYIIDKKIYMPLYRLSGVDQMGYMLPETEAYQNLYGDIVYSIPPGATYPAPAPIDDVIPEVDIIPDISYGLDSEDVNLSPELLQAIELLLYYNVLDGSGNVNDDFLFSLSEQVPGDVYERIVAARQLLYTASISGFFSDIFRGVKKVTLAVPRGAYLSLVALNVFGMATKLKQATIDQQGIDKVRGVWYKFGGDWAKLRQAIDNGSKRKRIGAAAAAIPAWVAAASAIIAAIAPIITGILKKQQTEGMNIDPSLLDSNYPMPSGSGSGIMDFIKNNALIVAGAAGLGIWYFTSRGRMSGTRPQGNNALKVILPVGAAVGLFFLLRKKEDEIEVPREPDPPLTPIEPPKQVPITPGAPITPAPSVPFYGYRDGEALQAYGHPEIYVIKDGVRHYVNSWDKLHGMGIMSIDEVVKLIYADLIKIPESYPL